MKIGIDIRTLMDKQYSGVPEHTLNLINTIIELEDKESWGNEYKLFYNSARDMRHRLPELNASYIEATNFGYPNKVFNYLLQKTLRTPKVDKKLGVDVILMPHINFAAISRETPSILTVHDISFLRYPEFFSGRKNFWHYMINVIKMIRSFDKIVAVSENTKYDIVEICGVSEEKIKVIYPGINRGSFEKVTEEEGLSRIKQKYGLSDNFIFFMGTLEPRKNIEGLIKAFDILCKYQKNEGYELVIAGGKGWRSEQIMETWKNSPYRDRIKFLDYVPREEKRYLYRAASVFAYPSFYEGFGFPPLEAMAQGTPVLTSFSSSLPEVVGDAALLVDPYNTRKIAYYLEQLLQDEQLREELRNKGYEQVKKYDWKSTTRQYLELITNLSK